MAVQTDSEIITKPAVTFLRGASLIPLLLFIQIFILFNGQKFWNISPVSTLSYMAISWGLLLWFGYTQEFKFSELIDMTNKKDLISEYITGKTYGLQGRSLVIQIIWWFIGFGITVFLLLLTTTTINWPMTSDIHQSQVASLIILNFTLVMVSETIGFHAIIPGVIQKKLNAIPKVTEKMNLGIRYTISQSMFALWHVSVYWNNPNLAGSLLTAFLFGCLFLAVRESKHGGIAPTMGIHAGFNLIVSGAILGNYIGI